MSDMNKHLQRATIAAAVCAGGYIAGRVLEVLWVRALMALGPANVRKFKGDYAIVTGGSEGVSYMLHLLFHHSPQHAVAPGRTPSHPAPAGFTMHHPLQAQLPPALMPHTT
jgi:hypothetical protein